MDEPTQAPHAGEDPPTPQLPTDPAASPAPPAPSSPVMGEPAASESAATVAVDPRSLEIPRGLFAWLIVIALGGLLSALLGHSEGALFFAASGVFVLAQATDAAASITGYRDWVKSRLPRASAGGVLFRLVVRSILPLTGTLFYAGIGAYALTAATSPDAQRIAAPWCFAAAGLCLLTISRRVADFLTRILFRTGAPGRTRRLTARIVLMALLMPVPLRALFPDLLAALMDSDTPLADPGGLISQLLGEVAIALAGVGLLVRRNWSEARERLGLVGMRPSDYLVVALGLGAAIGLNGGMEWLQHTYFPELWRQDSEMTKLIAADLPLATALLLGLSAGFGEEIAMRGALQPRLGIVLSAVVFACAHVQYTWFGMLTIGLLGCLLGLVRARTNTTTAIVVHALYDVFAAVSSSGS